MLVQCVSKNETRVILNILYSCKSIAMKFSVFLNLCLWTEESRLNSESIRRQITTECDYNLRVDSDDGHEA